MQGGWQYFSDSVFLCVDTIPGLQNVSQAVAKTRFSALLGGTHLLFACEQMFLTRPQAPWQESEVGGNLPREGSPWRGPCFMCRQRGRRRVKELGGRGRARGGRRQVVPPASFPGRSLSPSSHRRACQRPGLLCGTGPPSSPRRPSGLAHRRLQFHSRSPSGTGRCGGANVVVRDEGRLSAHVLGCNWQEI